jgi:C-terminal processing protease CtpA/Prc
VALTVLTALSACAAGSGSIGAVLSQEQSSGRVRVRETPPDLAAARGGLEVGDEILLVDGRDVRRMSPAELHEALTGNIGSTVRLTVFRADRVERITLTRTALEGRR